jgi:hypothetical protein
MKILLILLVLCLGSIQADVEIPVCWPCEGGK